MIWCVDFGLRLLMLGGFLTQVINANVIRSDSTRMKRAHGTSHCEAKGGKCMFSLHCAQKKGTYIYNERRDIIYCVEMLLIKACCKLPQSASDPSSQRTTVPTTLHPNDINFNFQTLSSPTKPPQTLITWQSSLKPISEQPMITWYPSLPVSTTLVVTSPETVPESSSAQLATSSLSDGISNATLTSVPSEDLVPETTTAKPLQESASPETSLTTPPRDVSANVETNPWRTQSHTVAQEESTLPSETTTVPQHVLSSMQPTTVFSTTDSTTLTVSTESTTAESTATKTRTTTVSPTTETRTTTVSPTTETRTPTASPTTETQTTTVSPATEAPTTTVSPTTKTPTTTVSPATLSTTESITIESTTTDSSTTLPSSLPTSERTPSSTPKPTVATPTEYTYFTTTYAPTAQKIWWTKPVKVTTKKPVLTKAPEELSYRDVCGIRSHGPIGRIVGGKPAPFARHPWLISLRQRSDGIFKHKCGAALLTQTWAITAAHCIQDVKVNDILLRIGEYDTSHTNEKHNHEERTAKFVIQHQLFDPRTYEYDLALVRLSERVKFRRNIVPVCLPKVNYEFIGEEGTVAGWGRLYEGGPPPSVLHEVKVPVITNRECESMYLRAGYREYIPDIFLCAGFEKGKKDSCEGDSGGPLVIKKDGRYTISGIISWGIGCAAKNQPGVYTNVRKFLGWITPFINID